MWFTTKIIYTTAFTFKRETALSINQQKSCVKSGIYCADYPFLLSNSISYSFTGHKLTWLTLQQTSNNPLMLQSHTEEAFTSLSLTTKCINFSKPDTFYEICDINVIATKSAFDNAFAHKYCSDIKTHRQGQVYCVKTMQS